MIPSEKERFACEAASGPQEHKFNANVHSTWGLEEDEFYAKVAKNVDEACELVEAGFQYVTGEYDDGDKIFRKRRQLPPDPCGGVAGI